MKETIRMSKTAEATFGRGMKLINMLGDPDRKEHGRIMREVCLCWFREKAFPYHYFSAKLYRREAPDYRLFVSNQTLKKMLHSRWVRNEESAGLMSNKLQFYQHLHRAGLPQPLLVGWMKKNHLHLADETVRIDAVAALRQRLTELFRTYAFTALFFKPVEGKLGQGCYRLTREQCADSDPEILQTILEKSRNTSYLLQESVTQHPEVSRIYPHSINTIRLITYLDRWQQVHPLAAYMRLGVGGAYVDNASAGGIFVRIDPVREVITGRAIHKLEHGTKTYRRHPDTGCLFEGTPLPFLKETLTMTEKAALCFSTRIVGWDVALSDQGPVIIEGNSIPNLRSAEVMAGGFRNHPVFQLIHGEMSRAYPNKTHPLNEGAGFS